MKIQDQNIQLYSRSAMSESLNVQKTQEQYRDGQLQSAQTVTLSSESRQMQESFSNRSRLPHTSPELQLRPDEKTLKTLPEHANTQAQTHAQAPLAHASKAHSKDEQTLPPELEQMAQVVEGIMSKLMHREFKIEVYGFSRTNQSEAPSHTASTDSSIPMQTAAPTSNPQAMEAIGTTGRYESVSMNYSLQEAMQFKAQGAVTTADGRNIEFAFHAQMAQSYQLDAMMENSEGLVLRDPLVINFAGQPAQMSLNHVQFDLDSDQSLEEIPLWQSGSGYLALDRNQNGTVDNGSELFGTQSGNGFKDLANYDQDQNGWIDENDAVFSQLKLWHQTDEGYQQLDGLLELGIGAIYLDSVRSDYHYRDENLETQAKIQRSGIVLMEDGRANSIQQIDLAV